MRADLAILADELGEEADVAREECQALHPNYLQGKSKFDVGLSFHIVLQCTEMSRESAIHTTFSTNLAVLILEIANE